MKARKARIGWTVAVAVAMPAIVFGQGRGFFPLSAPKCRGRVREGAGRYSVNAASADSEEAKPIILQRKPLELVVNLPVGSKAGRYELALKKGGKTLLSTDADASIQNGTTSFTAKLDLSRLDPGNYSMYVRQLPFDWNYYPVVIR